MPGHRLAHQAVLGGRRVAGVLVRLRDGRQAALDGDRAPRAGQVGDVQRDDVGRGRQRLQAARAAEAEEVPPVRGVGAHGVGRAGGVDEGAGLVGDGLELGQQLGAIGRGDQGERVIDECHGQPG